MHIVKSDVEEIMINPSEVFDGVVVGPGSEEAADNEFIDCLAGPVTLHGGVVEIKVRILEKRRWWNRR